MSKTFVHAVYACQNHRQNSGKHSVPVTKPRQTETFPEKERSHLDMRFDLEALTIECTELKCFDACCR